MDRQEYIRTLTETMESLKQRLFRYAIYRIGNQEDAEDILQNVYLSLIERYSKTSAPIDLKSYIFRSVVNACSDHLKRLPPAQVIPTEKIEISYEPSNLDEEVQLINSLVESMPEYLRDFVRLRIYAEMTFDEIANAMDVSTTTAKRRFYEGIEYLRVKYNII